MQGLPDLRLAVAERGETEREAAQIQAEGEEMQSLAIGTSSIWWPYREMECRSQRKRENDST